MKAIFALIIAMFSFSVFATETQPTNEELKSPYVSINVPAEMMAVESSDVKGVSKISLTDKQEKTFALPDLDDPIAQRLPIGDSSIENRNQNALAIQTQTNEISQRHTGL